MTRRTIDDPLADVFGRHIGRIKRNRQGPANRSGGGSRGRGQRTLLHQAVSVAKRTPEVMVKVSGHARGLRHLQAHFDYITRNGKVPAEDEQGQTVSGKEVVRRIANEWQRGDQGKRRGRSRDTVNLVLSMPPGTDRDKLKEAARQFAQQTFSADRRYLLAQHNDTDHPHCHLTLKSVGYDGRRLNPRKADLQAWREAFATCLREQGIEAEASSRAARGVVRKGKKQAVLHAERRGKSTVAKKQVDEALQRAREGDTHPRPWEDAIARRQQKTRSGWQEAASMLEASGNVQAKKLATTIRKFVRGMPEPLTAQQALCRSINDRLASREQPTRQAGKEPDLDR